MTNTKGSIGIGRGHTFYRPTQTYSRSCGSPLKEKLVNPRLNLKNLSRALNLNRDGSESYPHIQLLLPRILLLFLDNPRRVAVVDG